MSDQQLTDWFPGDVKPVRPGLYAVDDQLFSYFDGEGFGWVSFQKETAYIKRDFPTFYVVVRWRGLASDPNPQADDSQTDDHTGICEVTE